MSKRSYDGCPAVGVGATKTLWIDDCGQCFEPKRAAPKARPGTKPAGNNQRVQHTHIPNEQKLPRLNIPTLKGEGVDHLGDPFTNLGGGEREKGTKPSSETLLISFEPAQDRWFQRDLRGDAQLVLSAAAHLRPRS